MGNPRIPAIILAAGNSGRMGSDKARLHHADGMSFAEYLIRGFLDSGCDPVVMVVNAKFPMPARKKKNILYVVNSQPDLGRYHSIQQGLRQILPGRACFLQNVYNPFVESGLLGKLSEFLQPDGYVVPVHEGKGGHPILLGDKVCQYLQSINNMNNLKEALKMFPRKEVPFPDQRIHWNINTPEDYEDFLRLIEKDLPVC